MNIFPVIEPEYYPLKAAAQKLGCDIRTLVHLGAHNRLNIYIFANGWDAQIIELLEEKSSLGLPYTMHNTRLDSIQDGLVRISPVELQQFELEMLEHENVESFNLPSVLLQQQTPDSNEAGHEIAEFVTLLKETISLPINRFVIMNADLNNLYHQEKADAEKPEGAVSRKTLLKLIIGLVKTGYKYDPTDKKSPTTKAIERELNTIGIELTDDTIRKALKEAASVLPANPQ